MTAINGCPIESGFIGNLVDNECPHGRLPGDATSACGCWPQEHEETVRRMMRSRAPAITTQEAGKLTEEIPDAPFGYKADGTPRKRPSPEWMNDPAKLAAAAAKRAKRNEPALNVRETNDMLDRQAGEFDERLITLESLIDDRRSELAELEDWRERLRAGRAAINVGRTLKV